MKDKKTPGQDPKKKAAELASAKALDARLNKIAGVSFDQIRSAVAEAIQEAFPADDAAPNTCYMGPWVEDLFDDKAIFSKDGQLFSVGYTFADGKATLAGDPSPVMRTYSPSGGGAAPPPTTPDATTANTDAGKALRKERAAKAQAALEQLAKRATPAKAKK